MAVRKAEQYLERAKWIRSSSLPAVQQDIQDLLRQKSKPPPWLRQATGAFESAAARPPVKSRVERRPATGNVSQGSVEETIVFAIGTPVFAIRDGRIDYDSARQEAKAWKKLLRANESQIAATFASIGRIDVDNSIDGNAYAGTGWIIDDGVVITNRHVAQMFAEPVGRSYIFRVGFDGRNPVSPRLDFLEEFDNTRSDEVSVERVLWISPESGPDIAFLKLSQTSSSASRRKLQLAEASSQLKLPVAVVGYPARDTRFSDQALAEKIFGGVFDKKRIAVGQVLNMGEGVVSHSCSTLGGNSGSPLIDLGTGTVVGLHFRGVEFIENDAVDASTIHRAFQRVQTLRPWEAIVTDNSKELSSPFVSAGGSVSITLPLRITLELGSLQSAPNAQPSVIQTVPAVPPIENPTKEQVQNAVRSARALFANRPDVVAVKPGYRFDKGVMTDQRAVVVSVLKKLEPNALQSRGLLGLPSHVEGVRIDVSLATARDLTFGGFAAEAVTKQWKTTYKKRPDLSHARRQEKIGFIVHSGPDSGWPVLSDFLSNTKKSLVVGIFEFGARHIVDEVLASTKGSKETIDLILQLGGSVGSGTKKDDYEDVETVELLKEAKKSKFRFIAASVGSGGVFDSSYHIKVAVRDGSALWLSSGSWQSSNQPDLDPLNDENAASALRKYNREWHVVIEGASLPELFEQHIKRDMDEAKQADETLPVEEPVVFVPMSVSEAEAAAKPRYFAPLRGNRIVDLQPVLTPDNYIDAVLPLIESADQKIFFQNQSFSTGTVGGDYGKLLDALLAKQKAGLDVRIIFRSFGQNDRDVVSDAVEYGFAKDSIRAQQNCHTKGIIVDGERVLVGSHNWTTAGTGFNRDASLVFFDKEIAEYYQSLFLYDWGRIGNLKIDESLPPALLKSATHPVVPAGYIAVPLRELVG